MSQELPRTPNTAPKSHQAHWQARFNRVMGFCWLAGGLICNEYVVRFALDIGLVGGMTRAGLWTVSGATIGWGLFTIWQPRRTGVTNVNLVLLWTLFSVASVETALRRWPRLLGHSYANGVLTKYTTDAGGIYYWDPSAKISFMLPNYRTRMYYHGYTWQHETDALGFRNRIVRLPADIVLLGDSFIYGHGVELDSTVGHFLEQCSGTSVMNLARQGDYALLEAHILTEFVSMIRPRVVLYFFFENDILDAYRLPMAEMVAFAGTPVEAIRFPPRTDPDVAIRWNQERWRAVARERTLLEWLRRSTYLGRVWDWYRFNRGTTELMRRMRDEAAYDVDNETSPGWRLTKTAILYMKRVSEDHHARFVMAPITMQNTRHADILRRFARDHAIELIDTGLMTVNADRSLFLVEDGAPGHLSPKGARVMAELVCKYLARYSAIIQR